MIKLCFFWGRFDFNFNLISLLYSVLLCFPLFFTVLVCLALQCSAPFCSALLSSYLDTKLFRNEAFIFIFIYNCIYYLQNKWRFIIRVYRHDAQSRLSLCNRYNMTGRSVWDLQGEPL